MYEWAKKEVELAKERERKTSSEKELWDYGCACYDSALKAFKSLCDDDHSGMSIMFTKSILNWLIDGKALTPIEDTIDIWDQIDDDLYQCNRMSSLFKRIMPDGSIKYSDNNMVVCVDVTSDTRWHDGRASDIVYEKYPIMMPYIPEDKPYKVYTEDFYYLHPDAVGEYDHKAYFYMIKPDGTEERIYRYFAETFEGFKEIPRELYYERKRETFGEKH